MGHLREELSFTTKQWPTLGEKCNSHLVSHWSNLQWTRQSSGQVGKADLWIGRKVGREAFCAIADGEQTAGADLALNARGGGLCYGGGGLGTSSAFFFFFFKDSKSSFLAISATFQGKLEALAGWIGHAFYDILSSLITSTYKSHTTTWNSPDNIYFTNLTLLSTKIFSSAAVAYIVILNLHYLGGGH